MKIFQNKMNFIVILVHFIFLCLSLMLVILSCLFYSKMLSILVIIVLFIFNILFNIFSLFILKRLKNTLILLEESKLHNKALQNLYDSVRTFKHDFFNIIQSVDGYIKTGDKSSLEKYYHEIKFECDNLNSLSTISSEVIDDAALYSLINSKYYKAEALNISFETHFLVKPSSLNITPYELCRILGILLDNAIEAANNTSDKKVIFEIIPTPCFDSSKNMTNIIIENSYSNKDVDINRIFEKGFSSKEDDINIHGLGLWKVNKILQKHENLNLRTSKQSNLFKQVLEIY